MKIRRQVRANTHEYYTREQVKQKNYDKNYFKNKYQYLEYVYQQKATAVLNRPAGNLPSPGCSHAYVPGLFFGAEAVPIRPIITPYCSQLSGRKNTFLCGIYGNEQIRKQKIRKWNRKETSVKVWGYKSTIN